MKITTKIFLIISLIIIGLITYTLIKDYESVSYELEGENIKVYGYCYQTTCKGIIKNNNTITNAEEIIK